MFPPFEIQKTGLSESTVKKVRESLSTFPQVTQAILYGSRALGTFRNGSDIDLCLIGENLDSSCTLRLDEKLDELSLPYTFDISIYDKIDNPDFKEHIDRVGVVFYQKPQSV